MGMRTGSALLPLHGGRVPQWLGARMSRLARVICEAIVLDYGRDELLARLSHPFWFQSLGAVMGMDWHSSGITTSVVGALKRGLAPVEWELGLHVCGGRGKHSRRTPDELVAVGERVGLDGAALAEHSRLVAKVDSAAVQDGFQIYLHSFVVGDDGTWAVIQQGMNDRRGQARRYHWLSTAAGSFVEAPHTGIDGEPGGAILNLTDRRAAAARQVQVELVREGPDRVLKQLRTETGLKGWSSPGASGAMKMPVHHRVAPSDVSMRRLRGALAAAAERGPVDFADLLLTPGVGARTVESLALVAEVVHGAPGRFADPARFSYAHGGKDGHPFPVPLAVYDRTIGVLRQAVDSARLGNDDRMAAIRELDRQARRLEQVASGGVDFATLMERERRLAPGYGGRTVFGPRSSAGAPGPAAAAPARARPRPPADPQLSLFPRR